MMKNIGDREIIPEGGDNQHYGSKKDRREGGNSGASRRLAEPSRARSLSGKGDCSSQEAVNSQRQRNQEGKTANL